MSKISAKNAIILLADSAGILRDISAAVKSIDFASSSGAINITGFENNNFLGGLPVHSVTLDVYYSSIANDAWSVLRGIYMSNSAKTLRIIPEGCGWAWCGEMMLDSLPMRGAPAGVLDAGRISLSVMGGGGGKWRRPVILALTGTGLYYTETSHTAYPMWKSLCAGLTTPEKTALVSFGAHNYGSSIYAYSPSNLYRCVFDDTLPATQPGLAVKMTRADINTMFGYTPSPTGANPAVMAVGVHPSTGKTMFLAGSDSVYLPDRHFCYVTPSLAVSPGAGYTVNIGVNPEIGFGTAAEIVGTNGGFLRTTDTGATVTYSAVHTTSGFNFYQARAGSSDRLGVYANETYTKTQASLNNAVTVADKSTLYRPVSRMQAWAANTDNSVGLATVKRVADNKYVLATTADGGGTWREIAEQPNAQVNPYRGFRHILGDRWIFGDNDAVYQTMDNGASKTNITGDLFTQFSSASVKRLEFFL